jgi:hypothetical protein
MWMPASATPVHPASIYVVSCVCLPAALDPVLFALENTAPFCHLADGSRLAVDQWSG